MSKTIGVIGLGSIGMRHAKNLLEMGHKVAGWDPDAAKSKALTGLGGMEMDNPIPYDFETLGACDGVVIASPTHMHLAHLDRAVLRKKVTLVEKPISDATDTSFAKEILAAATKPVIMGNNLRWHPCVKKAKEWMGVIGAPIWASFTCSQKNTKYTDPCILNWGAHEIDLARYMLGDAHVTAAVGDDQIMDVCLAHDTCPSTVHVDYLAPVERRGFCIIGENGNIGVDLKNRNGTLTLKGTTEIFADRSGGWDQDYKDEMQAFIDLIDGKPHPEAATGADGLATLELILEAQKMAGTS